MNNGLKVHILDCGAMGTDIEQLLGSPKYRASRSDHHRPATWASASSYAVLVEHPGGTILWDTSVSRNWETEWAGTGLDDVIPYDQVTDQQYLDAQLRTVGYETGDIDTVVLSHLHMDHAGNAKLFDNGRTKLLVNDTEWREAMAFDGLFQGGHIKADYENLSFETVAGDVEIVPGVTLLEAPGHSWGTMAMLVDLPNDGPLLFTSDSVYLEETLEQKHWGSVVWDNRVWLQSLEKMVGIAQRTGAQMIFGHDSKQASSIRHASEGFYS